MLTIGRNTMEVGDIVMTPNGPGVITRTATMKSTNELHDCVNSGLWWTRRDLSLPMRHYIYKLGISTVRTDGTCQVDVEYRYFFKWPGLFVPGRKETWHPIKVALREEVSNDRMEDEP